MSESVTFQPRDVIFREGEDSNCAYLILEGTVEIFKHTQTGTVLLSSLGSGEVFGEMGIIGESARSASAAAVTKVVLQPIHRESFATLLNSQPQDIVHMVRVIMERLRETNQKLARLATRYQQFQMVTPANSASMKRMILTPLTEKIRNQFPSSGLIITSLPFRVGGIAVNVEPNPMDWNNLYIQGADMTLISRNHFAIQKGEGGIYVMDRGSRTGTIVNDKVIGANAADYKADLKPGDNTIIAGPPDSPYRFNLFWEIG